MGTSQNKKLFTDYEGFVEKFKPKKTTDDCYTPPEVYDAVLQWVRETFDIGSAEIVRPFYPGGDFENYDYPDGCVVVDNPPFSIFTHIMRWYVAHNIRFFLFAPHLTLASGSNIDASFVICDTTVTYDNGAKVNTSFATNLAQDFRFWCCPDLAQRIKAAQKNAKDARGGGEEARHPLPLLRHFVGIARQDCLQRHRLQARKVRLLSHIKMRHPEYLRRWLSDERQSYTAISGGEETSRRGEETSHIPESRTDRITEATRLIYN